MVLTEIGLLTDLTALFLSNCSSPIIPTDNNNMTNSIPTEIGFLTNLTTLILSKRLFFD